MQEGKVKKAYIISTEHSTKYCQLVVGDSTIDKCHLKKDDICITYVIRNIDIDKSIYGFYYIDQPQPPITFRANCIKVYTCTNYYR